MFQFHKVQLKVATEGATTKGFKEFQFHKVQLKDMSFETMGTGTTFQFHKVQLKVFTQQPIDIPNRSFQFHKVQLKGLRDTQRRRAECRFNSIRYN